VPVRFRVVIIDNIIFMDLYGFGPLCLDLFITTPQQLKILHNKKIPPDRRFKKIFSAYNVIKHFPFR
jgi:hypothetical protein